MRRGQALRDFGNFAQERRVPAGLVLARVEALESFGDLRHEGWIALAPVAWVTHHPSEFGFVEIRSRPVSLVQDRRLACLHHLMDGEYAIVARRQRLEDVLGEVGLPPFLICCAVLRQTASPPKRAASRSVSRVASSCPIA